MKLTIAVRYYGGTYIARVQGQLSASASCTSGADKAAAACAQKAFGHENFTLTEDPNDGKLFIADDGKEPA